MYFLGVVAHWAGVVIVSVFSVSPAVVLEFAVALIFVGSGCICVNLGLDCLQLLGESQYCFLCLAQALL